jgi:hypothetical protein
MTQSVEEVSEDRNCVGWMALSQTVGLWGRITGKQQPVIDQDGEAFWRQLGPTTGCDAGEDDDEFLFKPNKRLNNK